MKYTREEIRVATEKAISYHEWTYALSAEEVIDEFWVALDAQRTIDKEKDNE